MSKTSKILEEIGLTTNEADVYLAALSLGPTTVSEISKHSKVGRTNTYQVIESLKKKGLMAIEYKGLKKFYVAENPEKLEKVIDQRKERFKEVLPKLKESFELSGGSAEIKYYEGIEAVKSSYEELIKDLRPSDFYYILAGDAEEWLKTDPDFLNKFRARRAKINQRVRLMLNDTTQHRKDYRSRSPYFEGVKFYPELNYPNASTTITPHFVHIHQYKPALAILIDSKSVIAANKSVFDILWNSLPE